jgi:hypothetical protein
VDIDISTPEGWAAYQEFLATGHLPEAGAPGTKDPTSAESLDYSDATRLEAKLGRFKLGGVLADSEGHVVETHRADGTVETVASARFNDVGVAVRESVSPSGRTERSYSLLIEGADGSLIDAYRIFSGQSLAASEDGNIRIDFTASDLRVIRSQALDQLVEAARESQFDLSRDEIRRLLRDDPRQLERMGMNDTSDHAFELAAAQTPEEILRELYLFGGFDGNGSTAVQGLLDFIMATNDVRHDGRGFPEDHPDSLLPGEPVVADCE